MFEPWQLAMIDDAGYNGIRDEHIDRVAESLLATGLTEIDRATFDYHCHKCGINPNNFTQAGLDLLQERLNDQVSIMAKAIVQPHKKSINESAFSHEQIAMIWDFYVTKSIAASASQKRTPSDYGRKNLPWKEMCEQANLTKDNIKILLANSINKTLEKMELSIETGIGKDKAPLAIDIETPKICCLTPYTISDEDPPKAKVGEAESVLTHIRNAFAHGNTYYFDNKYVLFEDKEQQKITARILLAQQTLIDWISLVDNGQRFYIIHESKYEGETK